ncbi:HPr family phosphocarrier protein [Faecalicatena contorta]|uniref:HPr family phosphocarrier protein n=1 Tax=Faecalicatena contorta TaxID=39482 RepID=UPI001F36A92B|nr:HPr family phosphocarrier protein [Faecalicatena contorta]MCF2555443.1 HPr family phosphocarrier protein [Faecalicatena contorta]MCF2679843.1 HPr family phosphocarrier protein [Faecalicatena contorta]
MVSQKTTVVNKSGLHLRPAADLSKLASSMTSDITIVAGDKKVNPKSVLILMSAAITQGTEIEIICEGENEEEDLRKLVEAIESGLGEGTE